MKKILFVLTALSLAVCDSYADRVVLSAELEPYAKTSNTVSSVNTSTGAVSLEAGDNVAITQTNGVINIAAEVAAQVQPDWNQDDDAEVDFIKHKPTILTGDDVYATISNLVVNGGLVIDGVSYKLAVQPITPPPPPPAETTFTLAGGTEQTYNIVGALDMQWMIANGYLNDYVEWLQPITKAEIGTNVTSIGDSTFGSCTNLTSVTIPDSVTSIEGSAFSFCSSLSGLTIPDSVTSIRDYTFSGCSSLSSFTIPDSVTSIGGEAFSACASLSNVTIGGSVTSIGWGAFIDCSSLSSLTIPDSVTSIEGYVFSRCSGLTSVTMTGKTITQVQGMEEYPWALSSGCVITCSDGTITIP